MFTCIVTIFMLRVIKESLRSSGANVTEKHITDVSMSALFLMEAAKKCDKIFGTTPQSTAHTVRNSKSDIEKIRQYLLEKEITTEKPGRVASPFIDPLLTGINLLTKSDWLLNQLTKVYDNLQQDIDEEQNDRVITLDYELSDIA